MDRRELARALSSSELITAPARTREPWRVLGVTGSPGVGKSCLVDRIVSNWLSRGEKVAILAIDPSSPVTGGALLGDRMRMASVDAGDNVYFRSIATRNLPGGIPARLNRMVDLLVHEGWTRIIIETVGSGQSEIRIVAVADRLLLVEGPARGDMIQAEKAGADEALMLDPHGFVATCNSTHFFIVRDGELWTSGGLYCIQGITRFNIIEIAKKIGVTVRESSFSLTKAYSADEAFVTGTFAGVIPVRSIDGRNIGKDLPGKITSRLRVEYLNLLE